jgi:hypothetical protein
VLAALAVGAAVRALPGEALAWGALAGCLTALLFLMPEYFQLVRNLSGSRSGILLLALTLSAVAATALASPLARRIPLLGLGGVVCAVAGLGLLATIEPHSRYALPIAGLGLVGSGLGAATARLPRPSLVSLSAGAAVGLAIAGAGFQIEQASQRDSGATFQEALAAGVGWAALLLIALIGAATLAVWQERRNRGARPTSSEARPAAES